MTRRDDTAHCHCHGGRLATVLGDAKNPTIAAARAWTAGLANAGSPLYKLAFDIPTQKNGTAPDFNHPQIVENGDWMEHAVQGSAETRAAKIRKSWSGCCYFNEVLIFAHGGQISLHSLYEFAKLFFDRPIRRLILWRCASTVDAFPFIDPVTAFGELCYAVRPFEACPCGCVHAVCRSTSADGALEKCPVGEDAATTIVSAGYYWIDKNFYPSELGIDPADKKAPFEAPQERLIETTVKAVKAKNEVTWSPAAREGGAAFDGLDVKPPKQPPGPLDSHMKDPGIYLKPHTGTPHFAGDKRPTYEGPAANDTDCPLHDGCMADAH
jgi:hypothetical protein